MRTPCQRAARIKPLKCRRIIFGRRGRAGAARRLLPCARQNLPGVYRALTIPDHLWRYSGTVPQSRSTRPPPCASSDRMPPHGSPPRRRRGARRPAASRSPRRRRRSRPAPAASLRTIGGIDALIALQGQDDPAERRRRAVKRGRIALDALDELKIEVLAGTLGPSTLMRLKSATADLRDASGDAGLDAVLAEIELRLEVEIAKMSPPQIARFSASESPADFSAISGCLYSVLVGARRAHYKLAPRAGRLVRSWVGSNEEQERDQGVTVASMAHNGHNGHDGHNGHNGAQWSRQRQRQRGQEQELPADRQRALHE